TVNGSNEGPVAEDDFLSADEGPLGFATITGDLLENDSDPDGDAITVTAVDGSAANVGDEIELETDTLGITVTAVVEADGSVSLTPGADAVALGEEESDTVSFSYEITDAHGATSEATVTFTLNGANIAPDAQDVSFTSEEQTDGSVPGVTGNLLVDATDADGDDISIISINGDASLVGDEINLTSNENGYDVSVIVDANGDISLDPGSAFAALDEGEEETVTFSYEVSDGNGGTDTANVTLTVTGIDGNGGGPGGGGGTGQGNVSYNVVFIIDASGSAAGSVFSPSDDALFADVDAEDQNLNGDAIAATRLDAELYTVQQISNQLADLNLSDDIDIGMYASALDTTSGFPFTSAHAMTDADGNVMFEAGADLSDVFDGTTGNGPQIYNSGISAANDWMTIANADDQYDTTVNIVYVLSASNGIDFAPGSLDDADANLAGELDQMDQAFDFTLDTIFFDGTLPGISPVLDTYEAYGDGETSVVETATALDNLLDGVGDTVTEALDAVSGTVSAASNIVDDLLDTTSGVTEDLVS
ncbi:MAG: Ig-like domain-containing protein, partial [Pikeienuella sp.]